jgi:two-component system NarL family response regulator
MTVTVLVADDHRSFTGALRVFLGLEPGIECLADEVTRGDQVMAAVGAHRPDVLLLDVELPAVSGLALIPRLRQEAPGTKIVVFTAHKTPEVILTAVEAGAAAVVSKAEPIEHVVRAVRLAACGESALNPAELAEALRHVARARERRRDVDLLVSGLTGRERQVLELLVHGYPNEEIAGQLRLSGETVRTHVRNLLAKLGVHSKLEAVAFAVRNRVVDPPG